MSDLEILSRIMRISVLYKLSHKNHMKYTCDIETFLFHNFVFRIYEISCSCFNVDYFDHFASKLIY